MRYFLARQKPYNDKVNQKNNYLQSFLEEHLENNIISIPYLHNKELIDKLGDIDVTNILNFITTFRERANEMDIIDKNIRKRKDKIGRIIRLLEAVYVDDVSLMVPYGNEILIIQVENVLQKYVSNHLGYKYNNSDYKVLTDRHITEKCTTFAFKIKNMQRIPKPVNVRFPPHSIQQLSDEFVAKILS